MKLHAIQQMAAGDDMDTIMKQIEEEGPAFEQLDYLTGKTITPLHAHCSLREMSENACWASHEEFLHGVRMTIVQDVTTQERAFETQKAMNPFAADRITAMENEGYLDRRPELE